MEPTIVVSAGQDRQGIPIWQWGLLAAAVVLLLAGGYGYVGGSQVFFGSVEPDVSAGGTTYSALGVELTPGTYNLRLRLSHQDCRAMLNRHAYTVQIPELASWQSSGALSHGTTTKKSLGSSDRRQVRRPEATDSVVMRLPRGGRFSLRIQFDEPHRQRLEVRVKRVPYDPRLPLFAGVVVLVLAVALGDGLRAGVLGLIARR